MNSAGTPIATRRTKETWLQDSYVIALTSSRQVVDASLWFEDFKLQRAEDDAKPDAVHKSFKKAQD